MAAASTVTIGGSVTGLASGTKTLAGQLTNAAAPGVITDVVLQSGANTITVPSGSVGVLISPPSNNAVALTLKGVTGDTGVGILKSGPTLLALDPGTTSFVITAASLTASATELSFF